ncbi:hypothetical protein [Novosphingobium sp. Leaf2]|uniref:hypothetical protein n=1 Tax=Novosphingobium sp. Leaf2 TaxID=1735670 RepID=UPI0006F7AC78|nr:hypothetical protein [Novosphingobium sp. Leaf2]KQM22049.1 hypothetical protein ASE49_01710 [Novosphingobium sp. Leaf2]
MTFSHSGYAGRILYLDRAGSEWGRESFSATLHSGGRTLRALCEMDDARLHREVTWSLDGNWMPRDGFVRLTRDGVRLASCWYHIEGAQAQCEGVTDEHGRISRHVSADRPIRFLGTHPLAGDSVIAAARGVDDPGVERPITSAVNSLAHLGDEELDVRILEPLVTFIGYETITVAAGRFDARRYTIRWSDTMPHVTDFWVHAEDCLPLLTIVPVLGERYELVEFTRF